MERLAKLQRRANRTVGGGATRTMLRSYRRAYRRLSHRAKRSTRARLAAMAGQPPCRADKTLTTAAHLLRELYANKRRGK